MSTDQETWQRVRKEILNMRPFDADEIAVVEQSLQEVREAYSDQDVSFLARGGTAVALILNEDQVLKIAPEAMTGEGSVITLQPSRSEQYGNLYVYEFPFIAEERIATDTEILEMLATSVAAGELPTDDYRRHKGNVRVVGAPDGTEKAIMIDGDAVMADSEAIKEYLRGNAAAEKFDDPPISEITQEMLDSVTPEEMERARQFNIQGAIGRHHTLEELNNMPVDIEGYRAATTAHLGGNIASDAGHESAGGSWAAKTGKKDTTQSFVDRIDKGDFGVA